MWWLLRTWWWFLLTTVTVVAGHQDQYWGVCVGAPMPRWCSRLPWRRVSLPNWSTVSWRMRKIGAVVAVGVALGSAVYACCAVRRWAVMLADQVTARQIERVDRMERDDERYPTTVEGSVRLIDSY